MSCSLSDRGRGQGTQGTRLAAYGQTGMRTDDFVADYLDDWSLVVETVPYLTEPATEAWEVSMPGTTWSQREVLEEIRSFVEAEPILGLPFSLESKRTVTSWGADGAAETIVLTLAEWTAAGLTVEAGLAAVRALLQRVAASAPEEDFSPGPLDRDEALMRAEWFLARRFFPEALGDGPGVDLRLQAEEHRSDGSWVFEWLAPNGGRYSAEISQTDRYAEIAWLRRDGPSDGS